MHRTHQWLERCINAKTRDDQALFGIIQGGVDPDYARRNRPVRSLNGPPWNCNWRVIRRRIKERDVFYARESQSIPPPG